MTKATKAFYAYDEKKGREVSYRPGDRVPDHVAATVGLHVVDRKPTVVEDPPVTMKQSELDAMVADKVAEVVGGEVFTQADVDAARQEERDLVIAELRELTPDDGGDPPRSEAYDPGEYDVDGVLEYLSTLDPASPEYAAVIEAERAGKARKTILGD